MTRPLHQSTRGSALRALVAVSLAGALIAACGANPLSADRPVPTTAVSPVGDITVVAAASLTGTFTALGASYEALHPGSRITFSFGASSTLAAQITQGSPADVFASASTASMDQLVAAKLAVAPSVFARNSLEIAVPPTNPAGILVPADLAKPGVKLAVCAPTVPCGALALQVLAAAKLTITPVTQEIDVKATLAKVKLGEVDAGLVYVTDVLAAGASVKGIAIPAEINATTNYPVAILTHSRNPDLAQSFIDYVLSADGAAVFKAAGFAAP